MDIFLPIGLGVGVIVVREYLYQRIVSAMAINFDKFKVALSEAAGFSQTVDPSLALSNITNKLKTGEVLCGILAAASIIAAILIPAYMIGKPIYKVNVKVQDDIIKAGTKAYLEAGTEAYPLPLTELDIENIGQRYEKDYAKAVVGKLPQTFTVLMVLMCVGGLSVGAKSLCSKMQTFLPNMYNSFSALSGDAIGSELLLNQFYNKSEVAMRNAIIAASILIAVGVITAVTSMISIEKAKDRIDLL